MIIKRNLQRRIIELLSFNPRSIQELLQILQIPERTLRYHIAILRRQNLIQEISLFSDRRRKILTISKKPDASRVQTSSDPF